MDDAGLCVLLIKHVDEPVHISLSPPKLFFRHDLTEYSVCRSFYNTENYWYVWCLSWIIQSRLFTPSIKCILFDMLVVTFYFFLSISFFDKGEGGEESQQRQCSMEEEITQETGGKHCRVSVSPCMWICICAVYPCLCVSMHMLFTCACLSVWERITVSGCEKITCLIAYVWVRACLAPFKKNVSPPPDTPDPDTEIEKEEDESSGQAQTPADDSSVKVPLFLIPPVQTVTPRCFLPRACISVSLPPLPVSPCVQVPKRIEVHSIHTYVALYKFLPQEQNDLELQWVKARQTAYMQEFL